MFIVGQHCFIFDISIIEEIKMECIRKKTFRFKKLIINILALMLWTKDISVSDNNKTTNAGRVLPVQCSGNN